MISFQLSREEGKVGFSLQIHTTLIKRASRAVASATVREAASYRRGVARVSRSVATAVAARARAAGILLKAVCVAPQVVKMDNGYELSWQPKEVRTSRLPLEELEGDDHRTGIAKGVAVIAAAFFAFQLVLGLGAGGAAPVVEANSLCEAPVDAVLVMDISGSMAQGAAPSECAWQTLENSGGTFFCENHTEQGLDEATCLAKPDPAQCSSPSFTPEVLSKMAHAQTAANSFLGNMGVSDRSGLVSFSDTAQLVKFLSTDHAATQAAVNGLVTGGATNIGDAIGVATTELGSGNANPQANKVMILITDGMANKPNGDGTNENPADVAYAEAQADAAAALGYTIFTIGLGSNGDVNETMLQNIATSTGGEYFAAPTSEQLSGIYDQIAIRVCELNSIAGCKYHDANNNGVIDEGETALPGWEIVLEGDVTLSQDTDAQGCYLFGGLIDGTYTVSESQSGQPEDSFVQTVPLDPLTYTVQVSDGDHMTQRDFANYWAQCGNDIVDDGEQCDDGNLDNGDGCSDQCLLEEDEGPECGDGVVEQPEQCDDGNLVSGDGCSDQCVLEDNNGGGGGDDPVVPTPGDVIINEILQNPSAVSDSNGEWFELYNTTQTPIVLDGCVVSDNGGENFTITSLTVPAAGYSVLAKNGDSGQNGGVTPDFVYANTMVLSNSTDSLIVTCGQTEIDRVEYDNGATFPDPNGASMSLASPLLDNTVGSNWCESTSVFGDGDLGTPGALNDSCSGVELPEGSILGCKYYDENNNGEIDAEEQTLDGWTIVLEQFVNQTWSQLATTQTASGEGSGCYSFEHLDDGTYRVSEVLQTDWEQTFPQSPGTYEVDIIEGNTATDIDFANYLPMCGNDIVDTGIGEQCDDGNLDNGDGCSDQCSLEDDNGGGGNEGPTPDDFDNESECIAAGFWWYNEACHENPPERGIGPPGGGGGGSSSGGGEVAGATDEQDDTGGSNEGSENDDNGEVAGEEACGLYMDDGSIRFGDTNEPAEVEKLQRFLNEWIDAQLEVTGVYDLPTFNAVKEFQARYADEILTPWGITEPTGVVHTTTRRWINLLECPSLNIELPPLVPLGPIETPFPPAGGGGIGFGPGFDDELDGTDGGAGNGTGDGSASSDGGNPPTGGSGEGDVGGDTDTTSGEEMNEESGEQEGSGLLDFLRRLLILIIIAIFGLLVVFYFLWRRAREGGGGSGEEQSPLL